MAERFDGGDNGMVIEFDRGVELNSPASGDARFDQSAPSNPSRGDESAPAGDVNRVEDQPPLSPSESVVFVGGRDRQNDDMKDAKSIGLKPFPDIDVPELYPPGYAPPSLLEAAREAGIRDADAVTAKCLRKAKMDMQAGVYDKYEIDIEDAATILMYTADRGGDLHAWSPYLVINKTLETRDPKLLFACRHLIWKLLAALRKLPRVYGKSLFRGITEELKYPKGETICWHRFTSTTLDLAVTKNFMAMVSGAGSDGEAKGTIFLMYSHECWGYDIRPFSFFPGEEELLLEPESLFTVESQSSMNSLIMCQLRLVPHPLLLENRISIGKVAAEAIKTAQTIDRNVQAPRVQVVDGSITFNAVRIQWNDVISTMSAELRRDAYYEIMVKEEAGSGAPKMLPKTCDTQVHIPILLPDRRYQVKCRVNFGQNVTNWSQCSFKTVPIPVLKPTLIQDSLGFDSFMMSWNDVVDRSIATQQELQYVVQTAVGNNNMSNFSTDATTPIKIDGLSDGQSCRFRVKLVVSDTSTGERVDGRFSDEVEVRTFAMPIPQFSTKDVSFSSMTVEWGSVDPARMLPVGTPAGTYEIEWRMAGSGSWDNLYSGTNPNYSLQKLESGTRFEFRARYNIPGKSGPWSNSYSASTTKIPVPDVDYDPVKDIAKVSCRISNVSAIRSAFSEADLSNLQYEYKISDVTLGDSSKSFVVSKPDFSKGLTSTHEYKVCCRVVIGDSHGGWSSQKSLQMPEPFLTHITGVIFTFVGEIVWQMGILAVLFALILSFGTYLDTGETGALKTFIIIMLAVFGSMIIIPILVFRTRTKLPAITGLLFLPLTKLGTPKRRHGAYFYCVMLFLQYCGVMASLILLLLRCYGNTEITLFLVSIPVSFSFTIVPAITLPVLFICGSKGRRELVFVYTVLFPFWWPYVMTSGALDGMLDISLGIVFLPMYVAFGINVALVIYSVIALIRIDSDGLALLIFTFIFGIPVSIPTFLIMPLLIASNLDPESDIKVDYQAVFAPIYIDIILAGILTLFSYCIKMVKLHGLSEMIRRIARAASPCYIFSAS